MVHKSDNSALNSLCERQNSVFLDNKLAIPITFAALTTGTVATHALVTVTGTVAMSLFAVCSVDVAGAGTIEVGTALATAGMIAQTTGTDIDVGDIWHDAVPDSSIELTSVVTQKIVTQNVGYKITSATLTGGAVTFYIGWAPISPNGRVDLA
jgi:hypothetical protein